MVTKYIHILYMYVYVSGISQHSFCPLFSLLILVWVLNEKRKRIMDFTFVFRMPSVSVDKRLERILEIGQMKLYVLAEYL